MRYFLLYMFDTSPTNLHLMRGSDGVANSVEESNKHLLIEMAEKFKKEGLIADYKLVKEVPSS